MTQNRRDFIRNNAVVAAASAAGIPVSGMATNLVTDRRHTELKWGTGGHRFYPEYMWPFIAQAFEPGPR